MHRSLYRAYKYDPFYHSGNVIFVDANATGNNNGTSWVHAYTDLMDALSAASSGQQIWVAAGTYKPDGGTANRALCFQPVAGVDVLFGFQPGYLSRYQRNPEVNQCILSGDIAGGDYANGSRHVVAVLAPLASAATWDGCIIERGYASGEDSAPVGGGVLSVGGLYLRNVTVRNCYNGGVFWTVAGHGIYNSVIHDCTGSSASNTGYGLDMYQCTGTPVISSVEVYNCDSHHGGGVAIDGSSPTVSRLYIHDCTAEERGGALLVWGASVAANPTLTECVFKGNTATHYGGAVWIRGDAGASPVFDKCLFLDNISENGNPDWDLGGGGAVGTDATPTFTNCVFNGNVVAEDGVTGPGHGGSVVMQKVNYDCTLTMRDCICYGNSSSDDTEIYAEPTGPAPTITVTYSDVEGGYTGTGNIDSDPLFVDDTNAVGADGAWWTADDGLRLGTGSPCIGTGYEGGDMGAY